MPKVPSISTLAASSVDILNAIRANGTTNYQDFVPVANADIESIREIGNIIMQFPGLQNEFLSALVNRIGRVILTSKLYTNPWAMFKKGLMEFGETVEEIFVNIAKPFQFDPSVAETNIFKREIPDVRAAFHVMNYQKFYKSTVSQDQLRQAFLSWQGITDLISGIVDAMYTGAAYDEFQTMKYLLAKHILNGRLHAETIPAISADDSKEIVTAVKAASNTLEFMSPNYNMVGVQNFTLKNDQFVLVNSLFDAVMDVNVLATAFNMDRTQFMGHRVLVDSFGAIDNDRLALLFADDANYTPLTDEEKAALDQVPVVIVDRNFFMIFDNLYNFTEQYNGEGLYWNYWYHTWKTFSVSPFSNAMVFVPGTPGVASVTVSPAAVTSSVGQAINFEATVVTTGFAPKTVNWTIDSTISSIDIYGRLVISEDETATEINVTATSTYDNTKSGTAVVTIA